MILREACSSGGFARVVVNAIQAIVKGYSLEKIFLMPGASPVYFLATALCLGVPQTQAGAPRAGY